MAIALFDSNILIDHTLGIVEATIELAGYDNAAISAINWMETACMLNQEQVNAFDRDLNQAGVIILQTRPDIMRRAAQLRKQTKKKLPDCIIWATAEIERRLIVTRNPEDFGGMKNPLVRVPYKIAGGRITDVMPRPR
jgi:predicted nucleic acid-binding protein